MEELVLKKEGVSICTILFLCEKHVIQARSFFLLAQWTDPSTCETSPGTQTNSLDCFLSDNVITEHYTNVVVHKLKTKGIAYVLLFSFFVIPARHCEIAHTFTLEEIHPGKNSQPINHGKSGAMLRVKSKQNVVLIWLKFWEVFRIGLSPLISPFVRLCFPFLTALSWTGQRQELFLLLGARSLDTDGSDNCCPGLVLIKQ